MAYDPLWSDTEVKPARSGSLSKDTFQGFGGAVNDIFAGFAAGYRAKGNRLEAAGYLRAADESQFNKSISEESTRIQVLQQQRAQFQEEGRIHADVAAAGFTMGGSALDLLSQSHQQGELEKYVLERQGFVASHGYDVEAENYRRMADAANLSAEANDTAQKGAYISAGVKAASALLPFFE